MLPANVTTDRECMHTRQEENKTILHRCVKLENHKWLEKDLSEEIVREKTTTKNQ